MQILAATHSPQHGWSRKGSLQTLCRTGIQVWTKCFCLVAQLCPTLLQPHGLEPARLFCPWDFPGKNTEVSCYFLLQGVFLTQGSNLCLLHWHAGSLLLSNLGSIDHLEIKNISYEKDYSSEVFPPLCVFCNSTNLRTFYMFRKKNH